MQVYLLCLIINAVSLIWKCGNFKLFLVKSRAALGTSRSTVHRNFRSIFRIRSKQNHYISFLPEGVSLVNLNRYLSITVLPFDGTSGATSLHFITFSTNRFQINKQETTINTMIENWKSISLIKLLKFSQVFPSTVAASLKIYLNYMIYHLNIHINNRNLIYPIYKIS